MFRLTLLALLAIGMPLVAFPGRAFGQPEAPPVPRSTEPSPKTRAAPAAGAGATGGRAGGQLRWRRGRGQRGFPGPDRGPGRHRGPARLAVRPVRRGRSCRHPHRDHPAHPSRARGGRLLRRDHRAAWRRTGCVCIFACVRSTAFAASSSRATRAVSGTCASRTSSASSAFVRGRSCRRWGRAGTPSWPRKPITCASSSGRAATGRRRRPSSFMTTARCPPRSTSWCAFTWDRPIPSAP